MLETSRILFIALMFSLQFRQAASFPSFVNRIRRLGGSVRFHTAVSSVPELSPKDFKPFRISNVVHISENTKAFNVEASLNGMKTSSFIMVL